MLKLRAPLLNDFYVRPRVKYKVNLPLQMAECELNYLRLKKLLPDSSQNEREFAVSRREQQWVYRLIIIERSPYTTTLQLQQVWEPASKKITNTIRGSHSHWLQMPQLTIRMYHDALLAEVLAWEGHKRLRPRYEYPNQSMYQADEKLQINQFLGEWLMLCLNEGHETNDILPLFEK